MRGALTLTPWLAPTPAQAPLPHFDQQQAHDFIMAHGLAVRAVGKLTYGQHCLTALDLHM